MNPDKLQFSPCTLKAARWSAARPVGKKRWRVLRVLLFWITFDTRALSLLFFFFFFAGAHLCVLTVNRAPSTYNDLQRSTFFFFFKWLKAENGMWASWNWMEALIMLALLFSTLLHLHPGHFTWEIHASGPCQSRRQSQLTHVIHRPSGKSQTARVYGVNWANLLHNRLTG